MSKGSFWRAAGLNYLEYSNLAARYLRRALKEAPQAKALKREEHNLRVSLYENGKATPAKFLKNTQQ
ncbi:hypothetical protein CAOG_01889 [Capsaspora owczarzaki ATCC 30864]|uniref:Uncharacterized protein n=1 Tax=Capsaspora owczarzaki (strain ATCC 30864) TaxID=595528 RepID=A0A0D2WK81_CAPO3|nr:hypothetical protein CAOG_01889 [Capsaspora owczarzaki ATCC 30864]KJE90595.1 hypothetical protein CAOG_001889 [Capsaspora owczarzaki ATCC 30864]|eukprot:XP_004364757.1 hypothetical protein CAOG_01889 [Capsaspora owczarzaki ATCC 30864]